MLRGLYAAATALDAAQRAHETTADNLANSSTPGFRQKGVRFESFDRLLGRTDPPAGDILGTQLSATYTDFRPAAINLTGNPLDLALSEPDQFFVVQGPNGPLYTRDGGFRMTPEGRVVTTAGYPLLGENGPVELPPNAATVGIGGDGSVTADGAPAGRVRVARIADPSRLTPSGLTHFAAPADLAVEPAAGRVRQGYREASNVNPAQAMVGMIASNRYYDAAQRALRTIAESIQMNTRPQG
jgi:flagellar basal body rod protein FlgG